MNLRRPIVLIIILGLSWLSGCSSRTDDAKGADDSESEFASDRKCLNRIVEFEPNENGYHTFSISCGEGNSIYSVGIDPREGGRLETVAPDGRRIHIQTADGNPLAHANDINGDGQPDLIVVTGFNDEERIEEADLISFGESLQIVPIVNVGEPLFRDLDGDGILEVVTLDSVPFIECGCGAEMSRINPVRKLVLRIENGSYRLSMRDMYRPLTSEFVDRLNSFRKAAASGMLPDDLKQYMIELIYQGQGNAAWTLFDNVSAELPNSVAENFEADFVLEVVSGTSRLDDLMWINGWKFDVSHSCPESAGRAQFRMWQRPRPEIGLEDEGE